MYIKNLHHMISLRIPDKLLDKLGFLARKYNLTVSELIRSILSSYVNNTEALSGYEYIKKDDLDDQL